MSDKATDLLATLQSRRLVADRTMSFRFAKPAGWTYRAGQSIDMTLLDPPETDAEGNTRAFSLSSAPAEDWLEITTRLRDTAFKRVIQGMPIGGVVKIEGPFGDLRLHKADRPAVMLTGGIGITPFRSILVQAERDGGLPYRVVLLYANRRPEDAAFLDEIVAIAGADPNLAFVPVMSQPESSAKPWTGERGHIDEAMLTRHLSGLDGATYYLTGPPEMVKGLRSVLAARGVDDDAIRTEEFTGY